MSNNNYLIGYKFGVIWKGEENIEEYTIVSSNADIAKNEVNIDAPFTKNLINKNKNDKVVLNDDEYIIKYIKCPNFVKVCQERNITTLYHFTDIKNLDSIMEKGILSKSKLDELKLLYDYNDNERFDDKIDFISCSVEYPNGLLLQNFKNRFNKKYVILAIDIDVLNYKFAFCCQMNAATMGGYYIESISNFYKLFYGERFSLPINFPTNEQAEILIKDNIEPQYIKEIIFENSQDEFEFKNKYRTTVNKLLFNYRSKYLRNNLR